MKENFELRVMSADHGGHINVYIKQGLAIGTSVTMVERKPYEHVEPTLHMDMTMAQVLMNDLWRAGLRPTEGSESVGSLLATQKHLADMREIAFSQLGLNKFKV
jgi:hypothetical protein